MDQTKFWHETIYDALVMAVQASGGAKRVAAKIWPTLDPSTAQARLRGCLNVDRPEKLDPGELLTLAKIAREHGDNSLMEFLGRELCCEVKPIAPAVAKKREKLGRLLAQVDDIRRAITAELEE